jgi:hypothetical protein
MPPLIKGGQGRTQADLRRSASGLVWTTFTVLASVLALVAIGGAS